MPAATRSRSAPLTRRASPSIVVVGNGRARPPSRAQRVGSRIGSVAAQAAMAEKHTLAALLAAGIAGAARRYDWKLPTLGDLPPPLVWGLGAWAVGRFGKNKMAQHVATGLLSVGLYEQVAYTKETREALDALMVTQRTREEAETSEGPGVFGGNFDG